MYARLLFVVVGISGPNSPDLGAFARLIGNIAGSGGLAWRDAADIRFAHE
jgi:hypothetical protein